MFKLLSLFCFKDAACEKVEREDKEDEESYSDEEPDEEELEELERIEQERKLQRANLEKEKVTLALNA